MNHRVLVVDDEEAIVFALTSLLELENMETAGALDRHSAEELMKERFYSVIVTDIRVPTEAEGLRLLDQIRRLSPRSRVLSMTAYATPELEVQVRKRGSSLVVRKPVSGETMIEAINGLLAEIDAMPADQTVRDLARLQVTVRKTLFAIARRRYRLMPEESEDVVQEAWLLLLERPKMIHSARAWLAGTVSNLCKRQIDRSVRARRRVELDHAIQTEAHDCGRPETGIAVRQALAGLDGNARTICTLIGIEGYTYQEVSSRTGLPLGSIGPLYMRAKAKLRLTLDSGGQDHRRFLAA